MTTRTHGTAVGGARKAVQGKWRLVQGVTLGTNTKEEFTVFTESVEDTICYLVYKEIDRDGAIFFTQYTHIDGQELTKDVVEKALVNLQEYNGVCKMMLHLFAINNLFGHLY